MLHPQLPSAPAQISFKRVTFESTPLKSQPSATHSSLFWPPSDLSALSSSFPPTTSLDIDLKPKTGTTHLALLNSGTDLGQLGFSSLATTLVTSSSDPPSAVITSSVDSNAFASASSTHSTCESSPAMSAGNNYHFETPSLHQVSALTAPFATSSPALQSGTTSPSLHEQSWNQASAQDRKMEPHSPNDTAPTFQAPYAPKSAAAATAYTAHPAHQAHYNEHHDYQGFGTHPGVPQYFQHRASISGPSMDTTSYAERYENASSGTAAPAPPRVHGLAAWENASGAARPHTADGMFGQFGMVAPSSTAHESPDNPALTPTTTTSSSRPYTSTSYAGSSVDPYYAGRRLSMPDPSAGKVFSYMVPGGGEDLNLAPQGYGSHYFGNAYHAGSSKKRPRRRYDEIERLYPCSWPGCTKSYGTLNHLNAHVAMQKHGPKRAPSEFKDMRKAWRKQKKEDEQRRARPAPAAAAETRASFSGAGGNYAVGSNEGAVALPGLGQGSLAHLSRYSMSAPQGQAFYMTPAEGVHANATPVQYAMGDQGDVRLPYGAGQQSQQYGNLGAYLSAHRGSV